MQSFLIAWRFLVLPSTFAFPQLLGILLYFRLSRAPRWVAVIAGVIAPAIFFVWLAPILSLQECVRPTLTVRGVACLHLVLYFSCSLGQ
jgi:hypothetical protein